MFRIKPKLPVTEEDRLWVDNGFHRLSSALGSSRMLQCAVIEPTDEFFPDPFDKSERSLELILRRVCSYMKVDRDRIELAIIPDSSELFDLLPAYSTNSDGPAGLHFGETEDEKPLIGVRQSLLTDPSSAIATIAHELGHVILLDGGHMRRETKDMEPMTDLLTVYLGLGIFTANSCRQFRQYQDDRSQGWTMSHMGYLPEEVYGYALARFALNRREEQPSWTRHLNTNLKTYFRQSAAWLRDRAALGLA